MSNGATITNKPFGYLVWGVEDETLIVKGTNFTFENAKQGNQDLELFIRSYLHPKINFEIFEFDYLGKHIVLLRIPSAKGEPTHFQKKPYIRIGSNKTDLRNHPNYVRIIYNSQEDWSANKIDQASYYEIKQCLLNRISVYELYKAGKSYAIRKVIGFKVVNEKNLSAYAVLVNAKLKA